MPVIAVIKLTSERTSQLIAYKAAEKMVLDMQGGVKVSANVETETSVLERKEEEKEDGASLHQMVKFFVGQLIIIPLSNSRNIGRMRGCHQYRL